MICAGLCPKAPRAAAARRTPRAESSTWRARTNSQDLVARTRPPNRSAGSTGCAHRPRCLADAYQVEIRDAGRTATHTHTHTHTRARTHIHTKADKATRHTRADAPAHTFGNTRAQPAIKQNGPQVADRRLWRAQLNGPRMLQKHQHTQRSRFHHLDAKTACGKPCGKQRRLNGSSADTTTLGSNRAPRALEARTSCRRQQTLGPSHVPPKATQDAAAATQRWPSSAPAKRATNKVATASPEPVRAPNPRTTVKS